MDNVPVGETWLRRKLRQALGAARVDPLSLLFDKQLEVVRSPRRRKTLLCGRRAGKTILLICLIVACMFAHKGSKYLYAAQTMGTAKAIFWEPLRAMANKHGWPITFHDGDHIASLPNGSSVQVIGTETVRDLEKARGRPWHGVAIDECGAIRPESLRYFVEACVEPGLVDYKGWLILAGTCTLQAFGYFYEVTTGERQGYENFTWTGFDNPHIDMHTAVHAPIGHPDFPDGGILANRGWTVDHSTYQREYLAAWVINDENRIFRWDDDRNYVDALPAIAPRDVWDRILSIDFGVGHHTAWGIVGYPRTYGRDAYIEYSDAETGLAPTDACDRIFADYKAFQATGVIGDIGGIGKAYWAEWNKRYHDKIPMYPADKTAKHAALLFTSDALHIARKSDNWQERRGLFVLRGQGKNAQLRNQFATLQWNEEHNDVADGQQDDLAHMAMYGFRHTPAFANLIELPEPPPPPNVFQRAALKRKIQLSRPGRLESFRGAMRRRS